MHVLSAIHELGFPSYIQFWHFEDLSYIMSHRYTPIILRGHQPGILLYIATSGLSLQLDTLTRQIQFILTPLSISNSERRGLFLTLSFMPTSRFIHKSPSQSSLSNAVALLIVLSIISTHLCTAVSFLSSIASINPGYVAPAYPVHNPGAKTTCLNQLRVSRPGA